MIVNKKLDRLKQWGKERMGGDVRTGTSDEFKALEAEMQVRQEGIERLQQSGNAYVKSMAARTQGENKEKQLPVAFFGATMVRHGDDFEPDSDFGQCLSSLGRANERIARTQESYLANATATWLESLDRSLVQMKDYQLAKKKLEQRRLAYDTAQAKMQKSKREDFRIEEELRSQKAKYEESSEDVYRRMLDIKEAELDSLADLTAFLDAELAYYERSRDVLAQLRRDWPAQSAQPGRSGASSPVNGLARRATRSRSGTASSLTDRFGRITEDEPLEPPSRPAISSRLSSGQNSPRRELPNFDLPARPPPANSRSTSGFEGPTTLGRDPSPTAAAATAGPQPRLSRTPTEPTQLLAGRSNLRIAKVRAAANVFGDDNDADPSDSTHEPLHSRIPSCSTPGPHGSSAAGSAAGRRAAPPPPPPPPSRAKKPPPPPPMKRSALSTSEVPQS